MDLSNSVKLKLSTLIKYPVIYKKKEIGVVFQHGSKDWEANSFNSEIGHRGFDTREEAEKDVLDLYLGNLSYDRYLRKMGAERR
jgi:hypothetical protein